MNWALYVSILSFCVAAITFYLTNVQPPKITTDIGPTVQIYHGDHDTGGSTGLYLPVTFVNASGRTGVVRLSATSIYRKDQEDQQFFMTWKDFATLKEGIGWQPEEIAHALAIPAKATVSKFIWFVWYSASTPKLRFREGMYVLDYCYWIGKSKQPIHDKHEFFISADFAQDFELFLAKKYTTSKILWLDKVIDYNRVMSKQEANRLL